MPLICGVVATLTAVLGVCAHLLRVFVLDSAAKQATLEAGKNARLVADREAADRHHKQLCDRLETTANSLDDKKPLRDQADLWERIVEQIEALEMSWKDLHAATRMVEGTSATRRWAAIRTLGQRVAQAPYRNFQTNSLAGAVNAHPLARFHSDQKHDTPSAETQEEWSRAQDHALPADPRGPRSDVDFTRSCRPRGVELGRNRVAQFALQGEHAKMLVRTVLERARLDFDSHAGGSRRLYPGLQIRVRGTAIGEQLPPMQTHSDLDDHQIRKALTMFFLQKEADYLVRALTQSQLHGTVLRSTPLLLYGHFCIEPILRPAAAENALSDCRPQGSQTATKR